MNFNSDTSKQPQEVLFSRKVNVTAHPQLIFNNIPVHGTATQKHVCRLECFSVPNQIFKNILRICSLRLIEV